MHDINTNQSIYHILQKKFFPNLKFIDERERLVFLSYIQGFLPFIFDFNVKNVLEIGGGQSTYLLSHLASRSNFKLCTIDKNPLAIKNKLRSLSITEDVVSNINFIKGFSLSSDTIKDFYKKKAIKIGSFSYFDTLKNSEEFINISLDSRKKEKVISALNLKSFNYREILKSQVGKENIPYELLKLYRTNNDELSENIDNDNHSQSCLETCIKEIKPEAIFLDGGEFTSILEWNLVFDYQKKGDYVILHDIYFPKSIKNWLVASSIKADKHYEILFIDKTTPQGFLVAQRIN